MELEKNGGYNLPLSRSIVMMRDELRGNATGNACVIVHYDTTGKRTVLYRRSLFPKNEVPNKTESALRFGKLKAFLDEESSTARFEKCCQPANHYFVEKDTMAALFVKSQNDSVIGVAWLDGSSSQKALLMCGFVCYELGKINPETDSVLWESATQYLTDDVRLIQDAEKVDRVIDVAFEVERQIEECSKDDCLVIVQTPND